MKKKLGVLLFIYCLPIELSKADTTNQNGFCVIHYNEQVVLSETYKHTFMKSELQLCYAMRYYNCWKDVKKTEIRTRIVTKPVARTRIECCAGYKNTTVHENVYQCQPICDPPCIAGHCSLPGNCTCFHGYEHQESHKCIPSCKPDCINSLCTSPGHCECKKGYDKVNNTYCKPHCSQGCYNGVCHKPEECLCNPGYKKNKYNPFDCEPICEVACINATCISYNECTCWQGYEKISTQDNACKPLCELECLNGDCTAPNTCTCHDGYSMHAPPNVCAPDCADCLYGDCVEPNVCNCYENYTSNSKGGCEPMCNNCSNGVCIAPFECECKEGYQRDDENKCIPYCDSCENGECIEPNVCNCFEGYENSTGICYPTCEYGCFGGECITPNNCSCSEYDRVEENVCFPLQQNETNFSENITPKRFLIDIIKVPDVYKIYDLHLSTIYIKINCSYGAFYNISIDTKSNSSNSIECINIKNALGLYVLCLWNGFSSDIQNVYMSTNLSSIVHPLNETESEKDYLKLGMTILLPTEIMSEDENCYLCPSWKHLRTKMPGSFIIPLESCELKELQNALIGINLKGLGFIGLAVLVALISIISGLLIFYRKYMKRDYYVQSSGKIDEIVLSLNQEDEI